MKKYDKYKDSQVERIGKIPVEWKIKRIKDSMYINLGQSPETELNLDKAGQPFFQGNADFGEKYPNPTIWCTNPKKIAKKDNILLSVRAPVGEVNICLEESGIGRGIAALGSKYSNYYFYVLKNANEELNKLSTGSTFDAIGYRELSQIKITIPLEKERIIISDYLDETTKKLNKVIENKKRQVELLKEDEKITVDSALKYGIKDNIKYKYTDITWLDKIPIHWSLKRIKQISMFKQDAIKTGPFGSQLKRSDYLEAGDFKVYTQENIINGDFLIGENFLSKEKFEELISFELEVGDIALTTRGTIGKALIVPSTIQKGVMHPCLLRVQADEKLIHKKYLTYFFNLSSIFINEIFYKSSSTVLDVIYQETIKSTKLPVPPLAEQISILDYLDQKMAINQKSINIIESEISKLEEYKKILINDVVTGKMKVTA